MGQVLRLPANEVERLVAVRALDLADSGPTPELSALANLAQGVFDTPFAAVNVVDEDWQRVAGQAGIALGECAREISICTRVVHANDVVVIPDLARHAELCDMPYVTGEPRFRFYAGAPVVTEAGLVVGAFCVLDTRPRSLSEAEVKNLRRFAMVAGALLRLQTANIVMGLAERSLRAAAVTDPLTGFYNRQALPTFVDEAMEDALAAGRRFGALYLDMDGFKGINDRFGHHAGDQVLKQAADRIRFVIRAGDMAVRMGGDEFAVFLPDPPDAGALRSLSERIVAAFRNPFKVDGVELSAQISVGGAVAPDQGRTRVELLKAVDTALYEAKSAGRNGYRILGG